MFNSSEGIMSAVSKPRRVYNGMVNSGELQWKEGEIYKNINGDPAG